MANQDKKKSSTVPVRDATKESAMRDTLPRTAVRTLTERECEDCRATTAFQAWHDHELSPSFNAGISFADWKLIPKGKRAVIELVTAHIEVPTNEWVRLRMFTSLGTVPSNLDLFVTFQGNVSGNAVYIATHPLRVYSDNEIDFIINRDNATTKGYALICISGYIVG